MFRRIPHEKKVQAVKECLKAENIKQVAEKHDISESTLRRYCEKVIDNTEEVIPKGPIDALKKKLKRLWSRLFPQGKQ